MQGDIDRLGIGTVSAHDDLQTAPHIAHVAGHHAVSEHDLLGQARSTIALVVLGRDPTARRLDGRDAAAERRIAQ